MSDNKYEKEYGLTEKLVLSLKVHGLVKTLRFIAIKAFLPIYSEIFRNQNFEFNGKKYKYFFHNYNNTWDNERGVEVALFKEFLFQALNSGQRVFEIGNVLGRYFDNSGWAILDKFEKSKNVINKDIADFVPDRPYDLILSISTMEHIGFDDDVKDPEKVLVATLNIISMLAPQGKFMFSVPLGYNKSIDHKIFNGEFKDFDVQYLRRVKYREWVPCALNEVQDIKYDYPYSAANALAICTYINK